VALHRFVEPSGSTLRDDDALAGVLPGLLQGALSLLVAGVNLLWKTGGRLEGVEKKRQIKITFLSSAEHGYPSHHKTFVSVSFSNTSMPTSLGTQGLVSQQLPLMFSCDNKIMDYRC